MSKKEEVKTDGDSVFYGQYQREERNKRTKRKEVTKPRSSKDGLKKKKYVSVEVMEDVIKKVSDSSKDLIERENQADKFKGSTGNSDDDDIDENKKGIEQSGTDSCSLDVSLIIKQEARECRDDDFY